MGKVKASVTVARPAEAVYEFLLDLDKNAGDEKTESIVKEPGGPTGAGTRFVFDHGKGRETSMVYTALEPNRRIDFEGVVGPLRPKGSFLIEAGDPTRLSVDADANPQGPAKLASPIVNMIGNRIWARRLARMKSRLEGSTV